MHQPVLHLHPPVLCIPDRKAQNDRRHISRGKWDLETNHAQLPDPPSDALGIESRPFYFVHVEHLVSSPLSWDPAIGELEVSLPASLAPLLVPH